MPLWGFDWIATLEHDYVGIATLATTLVWSSYVRLSPRLFGRLRLDSHVTSLRLPLSRLHWAHFGDFPSESLTTSYIGLVSILFRAGPVVHPTGEAEDPLQRRGTYRHCRPHTNTHAYIHFGGGSPIWHAYLRMPSTNFSYICPGQV